ncbi:unnamed protein product [marine sediment metagenome]|uniref:Signal peptidase II n=1 Tax=marine sediment metagenome TaxID=412755 RepID=X0YRJ4_9ZZZZ
MLKLEAKPEDIKINIIYEDEDIIVLSKPAGIVVHPSPGHPAKTIVNALLFHTKFLSDIGGGATGNNLLDRIIFGEITDFLDFGINSKLRWPAFNIADSCVVIGFFILALLVVKGDLYTTKLIKE